MTQPLKVDILAREVLNRAAIAAGMGDRDEALAVCRDLVEVEKAYEFRLRIGEQRVRETGAPFRGRPMHSRFPGVCAVCSKRFEQGAAILYDGDAKKAAHAECGELAE